MDLTLENIAIFGYLLAFGAAVWGVLESRKTARMKNSTEMLHRAALDSVLINSIRIIHDIDVDKRDDIKAYAHRDQARSDQTIAIAYALNHWEYVAVGINNGIYDDKILKEANYNSLTRLYKKTRSFIDAVNEGMEHKTYYQEVHCLAKKWINNPLKHKKPK